jgi:hypothetical protein
MAAETSERNNYEKVDVPVGYSIFAVESGYIIESSMWDS